MPESAGKKPANAVATKGSDGDKAVSTFMKPATILFGLVFLAIGGCVLLYLKFRGMDKQIRVLTKQVAEVPSENDFRMAQESWARQFQARQAEQNTQILAQLDSLTRMAEATRAHLHQIETRQEADVQSPTSQVNTSEQFTVDADNIQLATGGEVCESEKESDCEKEPVVESECEKESEEPVAESKVEQEVNVTQSDDGDDDMPQLEQVAPSSSSSSTSDSSESTSTSEEPMPQPRLPNAFTQPLVSPVARRAESPAAKPDPKEDVEESSVDLDADESELETDTSN